MARPQGCEASRSEHGERHRSHCTGKGLSSGAITHSHLRVVPAASHSVQPQPSSLPPLLLIQVSLDSCVASLRPPCPQPVCCQLQPGSVERRQRMSRPLLDPVRSSWGRVGAALGPAHLSASPRQGPSLLPLGMVLPCVEASAHGCRCCRQAHWAGTGYGATGIPPWTPLST